jgi:hypothetical protein
MEAFVDVALVDRSSSIAPDELARALREAADLDALVLFDETAHVASPTADAISPQGERTDLAAGLALAGSLVPLDRPGRIVVWTDGRSATRAWPDLARLTVETRPLQPRRDGPAILYATTERTEVAPGSTVVVRATVREGGELTVRRKGETLAKQNVDPGDVSIPVSIPTDAATGPLSLDLELADSVATLPLVVKAPPRVLVIAPDRRETKALEKALAAEAFDVIVRGPRDAPALDDVDLVVLTNTPTEGAGSLSPVLVRSLGPWVRAGGGLVAVGGEHAYDLGGWRTSPLADLLPVEIEFAGPQQQGALSLVLALDKSGSMAVGGGDDLVSTVGPRMTGGRPAGSKIRLVTDAMGAAIERLRPTDKVGVLAIDTAATWTIPLQLAEPKAPILTTIGRMTSGGGGIYISTALGAARDALLADTAPLRHIVLFADTDDAGEERTLDGVNVLDMVRAMTKSGITLSVIGIGQPDDPDAGFLADLATNAGGRFLLASSTGRSPHALHRRSGADDQEESRRAAVPRARPRARRRDRRTGARRGASARQSQQGEAARAREDGADGGRARAAPRDLAGRSRARRRVDVRRRRTMGGLLDDLARLRALLDAAGPDHGPRLRRSLGARARARRRRLAGAAPVRDADDRSQVLGGKRLEVDGIDPAPALSLEAPGLYTAFVPAAPGAFVTAQVRDGDTVVAERTAVAPPSEEHRWLSPDEATLAAIAHPAAAVPVPTRAIALWRWLLWLAVLLLPVDAMLRRPLRR